MKAKELMIGDWVYNTHNRKPEQVCEIRERMVMLDYNDLYDYDEIEPISLTPEILEKNGFEKEWDEDIMLMVCDGVVVEVGDNYKRYEDGKMYLRRVLAPLCYVHQLQHAMRICGIEKEIIL